MLTLAALDPEWTAHFPLSFQYETKYVDKLHRKHFSIKCFDKDRIKADDFIGGAELDLRSIATGPALWNVVLKDVRGGFRRAGGDARQSGQPRGRLQMRIEMEQLSDVTVQLKHVAISGLPTAFPVHLVTTLSRQCAFGVGRGVADGGTGRIRGTVLRSSRTWTPSGRTCMT